MAQIIDGKKISSQIKDELKEKVAELKALYGSILADEEVVTWLSDTMLLEVDTMSEEQVLEHIENVKNIVNEYYDLVAN